MGSFFGQVAGARSNIRQQQEQESAQKAAHDQAMRQKMLELALGESDKAQARQQTARTQTLAERRAELEAARQAKQDEIAGRRATLEDNRFGLQQQQANESSRHNRAVESRPVGGGSEPSWQITDTDNGKVQVNPKTGEVRPIMAGGQQLHSQMPTEMQNKIAANQSLVSQIDEAIAALKAHPGAVGLTRGTLDLLDQKSDPDGVGARALLANIGSAKIHDRSGGAVSVSEFPRLAPFVPSVRDQSNSAIQKLLLLKKNATNETDLLKSSGGRTPPAANSAPQGGSQGGKKTGNTVTVNGKTFIIPD